MGKTSNTLTPYTFTLYHWLGSSRYPSGSSLDCWSSLKVGILVFWNSSEVNSSDLPLGDLGDLGDFDLALPPWDDSPRAGCSPSNGHSSLIFFIISFRFWGLSWALWSLAYKFFQTLKLAPSGRLLLFTWWSGILRANSFLLSSQVFPRLASPWVTSRTKIADGSTVGAFEDGMTAGRRLGRYE